jgi:diaminopimelate epimerase
VRFAKVHGLGNDFVLLDLRQVAGAVHPAPHPDAALARRLCDRHLGIGADGLLTLLPGPTLVIHNPDGSRPQMCGNGARAAALWIATDACTRAAREVVPLATDAGLRICRVDAPRPDLGQVEIGMGPPGVEPERPLPLSGGPMLATPVSMGNPHRVLFFGERPPRPVLDLARDEGPALCAAEDANIEFVRTLGPQRYEAAVWERGAGLTQACGTGACAIAAAAIARGLARGDLPITVELPGGPLTLEVVDGQILMTGPAQLVFRGEVV